MNGLVASAKSGFRGELLETYHFLRALTHFSSKVREPSGGIDGCLHFFGRIPLRVTDTPSLYSVYYDFLQYRYHPLY